MVGVAVGAEGGLSDPAPLDLDAGLHVADGTPEEGLTHLGHQVGGSDHHPGDGDELVNVLGIEGSHVASLVGVERPHLDLVAQHRVGVTLEEHLVHRHVKSGDHLCVVTTLCYIFMNE